MVRQLRALNSPVLAPNGVAVRAVRLATSRTIVLASSETLTELADVLDRLKFDPYASIEERRTFLRLFARIAEQVAILRPIQACRDPRDDKFLAVAVNGGADVIVTGDADLLVLDPFHAVRIMTPAAFLSSQDP